MSWIFILSAAALVSFLGSVQAGPLNLYVLNTAIIQNRRSAFFIAIGGVIPEFVYAAIALFTVENLSKYKTVTVYISYGFIAMLLILAIYCFLKVPRKIDDNVEINTEIVSPIKSMLKGLFLAGFNPQLLPFWIGVLITFQSFTYLKVISIADRISFCLGATFGAFVLQLFLILLTKRFKTQLTRLLNHPYFYKFLGLLFLLLVIQQIIQFK